MKKFFALTLIALFAVAGNLFAGAQVVYDSDIVGNSAVMSDANYSLDLKTAGVDWLSVQGVWSQNTYPATTFSDGVYASGKITISTTTNVAGSTVTINGARYVEGIHWSNSVGYSTATAASLYTVLVATYTPFPGVGGSTHTITLLNSIINFSRSGDVIYSTAIAVGTGGNYAMSASTPAITVVTMAGGAASDMNTTSDYIAKVSTYPTALPLLLTVTSGALPAGLSANTTYYALQYPPYYLRLSTTAADANAGLYVSFGALTPTTSESFMLTPIRMQAGSNYSFKWQASNDNSTWYDMSATSVTITSASSSGNLFWDFGFTTYRYIRAALSAGSFGAVNLKLRGYGKR